MLSVLDQAVAQPDFEAVMQQADHLWQTSDG